MSYSHVFILTCLVPFLACTATPTQITGVSEDEIAVMKAAVDSLYCSRESVNADTPKVIVMFDSTVRGPWALGALAVTSFPTNPYTEFRKVVPDIDSAYIQTTLMSQNRSRWPLALDSTFSGRRVHLYSNRLANEHFAKGGGNWKAFYEMFPGSNGVIGFSRVAIDVSRTTAVVFYSHASGDLSFDAGFLLLRRIGPTWRIKSRVVTHIS